LVFGIGKQYRVPHFNPMFVGNDVTYRRARSVNVGSGDARRVFGMDHSNDLVD
jgi:hypothetical protein